MFKLLKLLIKMMKYKLL